MTMNYPTNGGGGGGGGGDLSGEKQVTTIRVSYLGYCVQRACVFIVLFETGTARVSLKLLTSVATGVSVCAAVV